MNKLYILLLLSFLANRLPAQTLFTYGHNTVSKEEFLKAYNKNRTAVKDKQQSLREYLDLYIKFKLKVKSARDQRLDTLPSMLDETNNFREQIEASYLNNDSIVNAMVNEAFQRQQKDIHVVHYYIVMPDNMPAKDSMVAYKAIQNAYQTFNMAPQKKIYPSDLVRDLAVNYAPVQKGDFGYITAFSLPYQYENIVYALKPGEASKPYRSKNAWHFFVNVGEREAVGRWKMAQIFLAIPKNATAKDILPIQQKADSIYALLADGIDFGTLAKQYSQDKNTYMNAGKMAEFGTGKYDTAFDRQAFALNTDSAISKPFRLADGFHILKRLSVATIPTNADVDYLATLKQQVLRDPRSDVAKERFVQDLLLKTKYKRNTAIPDSDLIHYGNLALVKNYSNNTTMVGNDVVIFSFAKETIKMSDWLKYVSTTHGKTNVVSKVFLDQYINAATLSYYKDHLEDYNVDFKYQMQEFIEGNLLFEVMQKEVWNKAATDSAGLLNYYNQHKEKYTWNKSASLILFTCTDSFAATEVKDALMSGKNWRSIVKESQGRIQADSNRYELSQVQLSADSVVSNGLITDPLYNIDNTASLAKVVELYPANQPRSFVEAKGLVINDYQDLLEEEWMAKLKKQYPITIDEKVFKSL